MIARAMVDKSELARRLERAVGRGHLLAIEAKALVPHVGAISVRTVGPDEGLPDEVFDAALVGGLGSTSPRELARQLASRVRSGGSITFALPTTRTGLKGATGSLLGMLRRRKPVPFEELCEALLFAGLHTIEAAELDDASGTSVVSARVP